MMVMTSSNTSTATMHATATLLAIVIIPASGASTSSSSVAKTATTVALIAILTVVSVTAYDRWKKKRHVKKRRRGSPNDADESKGADTIGRKKVRRNGGGKRSSPPSPRGSRRSSMESDLALPTVPELGEEEEVASCAAAATGGAAEGGGSAVVAALLHESQDTKDEAGGVTVAHSATEQEEDDPTDPDDPTNPSPTTNLSPTDPVPNEEFEDLSEPAAARLTMVTDESAEEAAGEATSEQSAETGHLSPKADDAAGVGNEVAEIYEAATTVEETAGEKTSEWTSLQKEAVGEGDPQEEAKRQELQPAGSYGDGETAAPGAVDQEEGSSCSPTNKETVKDIEIPTKTPVDLAGSEPTQSSASGAATPRLSQEKREDDAPRALSSGKDEAVAANSFVDDSTAEEETENSPCIPASPHSVDGTGRRSFTSPFNKTVNDAASHRRSWSSSPTTSSTSLDRHITAQNEITANLLRVPSLRSSLRVSPKHHLQPDAAAAPPPKQQPRVAPPPGEDADYQSLKSYWADASKKNTPQGLDFRQKFESKPKQRYFKFSDRAIPTVGMLSGSGRASSKIVGNTATVSLGKDALKGSDEDEDLEKKEKVVEERQEEEVMKVADAKGEGGSDKEVEGMTGEKGAVVPKDIERKSDEEKEEDEEPTLAFAISEGSEVPQADGEDTMDKRRDDAGEVAKTCENTSDVGKTSEEGVSSLGGARTSTTSGIPSEAENRNKTTKRVGDAEEQEDAPELAEEALRKTEDCATDNAHGEAIETAIAASLSQATSKATAGGAFEEETTRSCGGGITPNATAGGTTEKKRKDVLDREDVLGETELNAKATAAMPDTDGVGSNEVGDDGHWDSKLTETVEDEVTTGQVDHDGAKEREDGDAEGNAGEDGTAVKNETDNWAADAQEDEVVTTVPTLTEANSAAASAVLFVTSSEFDESHAYQESAQSVVSLDACDGGGSEEMGVSNVAVVDDTMPEKEEREETSVHGADEVSGESKVMTTGRGTKPY